MPVSEVTWGKRVATPVDEPAPREPVWQAAAQRVFTSHAGRYSQRRLRAQLRQEGHKVGQQRLRGQLSGSGLWALCTRTSFRPCALLKLTRRPWPLLATQPATATPNQIWVGDSTYLALVTYLARWRDASSRRAVGWHMSELLHMEVILNALNRAMAVCQPPPSLLVHANRGSQYTSETFTTLLDRTQTIASLSRSGNPYEHALAESDWSILKTQLLPRSTCFAGLEEARLGLAQYLDHYYNTQRLHSALGYCTPPEIKLYYPFFLPQLGFNFHPTTSKRTVPTNYWLKVW